MDQTALLAYFEYNARANQNLLATVALLPAEVLDQPCSPSHGTIRALLVHTLESEAYFLNACQEKPFDSSRILALASLDDIRSHWERLITEGRVFLSQLTDTERSITLRMGNYESHLPLWQWLHLNWVHSIHHRGELSVILTQQGHPLPELEQAEFFLRASGQDWPF